MEDHQVKHGIRNIGGPRVGPAALQQAQCCALAVSWVLLVSLCVSCGGPLSPPPAASSPAPPPSPPKILRIFPIRGAAIGGTKVTLVGDGFAEVTEVRFGKALAKVRVVSNTRITTWSPAGTGTVVVTVFAASGTSTAPERFSYIGASRPSNSSAIELP
jgi:hypothetical protein